MWGNVRRFVVLALMLLLVSCSSSGNGPEEPTPEGTLPSPSLTTISAPDPERAVSAFLEAWKAGDFQGMYAWLSPLSQDAISEEDFIDLYEQVQRIVLLTDLDFEIVSSLVNPQAAQVRYRLRLQSAVVGEITRETWVDLKRSGSDSWTIAWSRRAILPELEGDHGLFMDFITPTRANIYDRNGLALAVQDEVVALWIVPDQIVNEDDEERLLSTLGRLLDRPAVNILAEYEDFRGTNYFIPLGEVSVQDFQRYEGTLSGLGGIQWAYYSGRHYVGGGVAPHAVGYVAQIQQEQLELYLDQGYLQDAFVGQTGIEFAFEDTLRGTPGGTLYLTNPEGKAIQVLASRETQPPKAVYTTLDRNLQRWAQSAIAGFRGAIVVLERDTGAVLAMVSAPGFDPNLFDSKNPNSGPGLTELISRGGQALLNRATHGLYPMGSVFKPITMAAALDSGYYSPESIYTCNAEFRELPGLVLYDWTVEKERPPHGEVTLVQGLERSCNPYFWHIGLDLYNRGLTTAMPDMAARFGLGQATDIEIGETLGQVPNPDWKQANVGEPWGPGDAVQLAIGQASLNVTPLQVARYITAIGNGGLLLRPQIISRIQAADGPAEMVFEPEVQADLELSPETLSALHEAMFAVTSSPQGTARRTLRYPSTFSIKVAGKTGTAETGAGDPHSWFGGYTFMEREDKPDITVVVIVESQGEGSEWAAPIFRRVVEAYFFDRPFTLYRWESEIGVTRTATPEVIEEPIEASQSGESPTPASP